MNKIVFILTITLLTGCAYRSVIITPRNKGDANINYSSVADSLMLQKTNSILTNSKSLERLISRNKGNEGSFYFFMSNSKVFIEARQVNSNRDSVQIVGTLYDKEKKDTLGINLRFEKNIFKLHNENFGNRLYLISLNNKRDSLKRFKDDFNKSISFKISKSQNFLIDKNTMEVLTGEISNDFGGQHNFVIINDPGDLDEPIASLWIFSYISTQNEKEPYLKKCKIKHRDQCPNGYDIYPEFNWTNWFYQDIKCFCKQKK